MRYRTCLGSMAMIGLMGGTQHEDPAKAEAHVKMAITFAKQNGIDKLIKETNFGGGKFHVVLNSEIYIFIYDLEGVCVAIGFNPGALVGRNRFNLHGEVGVFPVREFIKVAKTKGKGWVNYKYFNPTTNKIENKISYIELYQGLIIGCGVYRD